MMALSLMISEMGDVDFDSAINRCMGSLSTVCDFITPEGDEALEFLAVSSSPPLILQRRQHLADRLAELNFAKIYKKIWNDLFLNLHKLYDRVACESRLNTSMTIMWNSTDKSTALCQQCLDCCVHQDIFRHLGNDKQAPSLSDQFVEFRVRGVMGILHNIVLKCDSREIFRGCQAFTILQRFLNVDNEMVKCIAQLVLAYIITEDENDVINTDDTNIVFLLTIAKDAIASQDHISSVGFSAVEILNGLTKLAANDSNKYCIVQNGGLLSYLSLMDEQCSPHEQLTAARGMWVLAFKCKDSIIKQPGCIEALKRLASTGVNDPIKKEATGALWILKEKQETTNKKTNKVEQPSLRPVSEKRESLNRTPSYEDAPHVMISYQWKDQSVLLKVRDRLMEEGYKVWMDVDNMSGSILEAMAEAVEKSAVVIVCMSQKYKDSSSCRTEAEYTFRLQKDIVPLVLQPRYRADGWLGALCGSKLYFDFSQEQISESLDALVKELKNRGKLIKHCKPHHYDAQLTASSVSTKGEGDVPVVPHVAAIPVTSRSQVIKWTNQDVMDWLEQNNLPHYKKSFAGFNGKLLIVYRQMHQQAPDFFYKSLDKLGLSLVDSLSFTDALTLL